MARSNLAWRIERVVAEVSIYAFFKWIGKRVLEDGKPRQIRCPFPLNHSRGDLHPSARIFPDSNKIHCFTEAKSRDVIDCVQDYFGLTLLGALQYIEKKLGWSVIAPEKVKFELENALTSVRKKRQPKNIACETSILDMVSKLRETLNAQHFSELAAVIIYIWDVFEEKMIRKANLQDKIEWENWARYMLTRELKMIKVVSEYQPTSAS